MVNKLANLESTKEVLGKEEDEEIEELIIKTCVELWGVLSGLIRKS